MNGFENRLIQARKDNHFTQEELALRLGVTPQAISKWERGMGYPDIELAVSLSHLLNCSLDYMFQGEERMDFSEKSEGKPSGEVLENILAEPLLLEIGTGLVAAAYEESTGRFAALSDIRKRLAGSLGLLLPKIRIRDREEMDKFSYRILAYDEILYESTFTREEEISFTQIYTDLEKVSISQYGKIINKQLTKSLTDNLAEKHPEIIKGVVPEKISLIQFQKLLIQIYEKKGNLHNLIKIVELLDEKVDSTKEINKLADDIIRELPV